MTLVDVGTKAPEDVNPQAKHADEQPATRWAQFKHLFFKVKQFQWPLWATVLWVLFGTAIAAYISINREWLLSSNFGNDAELILKFARMETDEGGSYRTIANVYTALGLVEKPIAAGLVGVFIAAAGAAFALVPSKGLRGVFAPVALFGYLVLSGAFVGTYTKELIVVSIVALICVLLSAPSHWSGDLLIVASIMLVAGTFRPYWIFLAMAYIALRIVPLKRLTVITLPALLIAGNLACSIAIFVLLGQSPDFFRTSVNVDRGAAEAGTMITRFVDGSAEPFAGALNNLLVMLTMVFPVPMLLLGSLYYLVNTVLFISLWGFAFLRLFLRKFERPVLAHRLIALLSGFLVSQGLFEPDYGSALRHLTPFIPLILALWMINFGNPRELKSNGTDFAVPSFIVPGEMKALEAGPSATSTELGTTEELDRIAQPLALLNMIRLAELERRGNSEAAAEVDPVLVTAVATKAQEGAAQDDREAQPAKGGSSKIEPDDAAATAPEKPSGAVVQETTEVPGSRPVEDEVESRGSSIIPQPADEKSELKDSEAADEETDIEADVIVAEPIEEVEVEAVIEEDEAIAIDDHGAQPQKAELVRQSLMVSGAATTVSNQLARAISAAKANLRPDVRWVTSLPPLIVETVEDHRGREIR
ncbi:hypothetical protein CGLAU_05555 [Corynebacterium glaucum]|uniref:Uncharacterized protein n=1 Tax=Corynebacterium glaucum TaxID=187491 RepID=A0A1Q2HW73_9CORY|nr:hypothetical protein [Corynebacterium glaucum]AQQ15082.1 hypothetical protein CGLAU_05555 [Corynebacterium glaucum]WJZ07581.1 hypothetical protein CGLAUT_05420 [Corynebacterium glaucum]